MNRTLLDSNSDEEIVLDITGFHDEEVQKKQSLTGCDHSESHLREEGNDVFTLNGRIKGKFVRKNVVNLFKWKLTKEEISLLSKGLKFICTKNHINLVKLKTELEELSLSQNRRLILETKMQQLKHFEQFRRKLLNIEIMQNIYNSLAREGRS